MLDKLDKAKTAVIKAGTLPLLLPLRKPIELRAEDVAAARTYIAEHWEMLAHEQHEDVGTLIGLPHPYLVPSVAERKFHYLEQYYWDSYFISLGLKDQAHQALVEGMLDNLVYLFNRFQLIPNASRMYLTSRSQPPLLTSFIFHIYDTYDKSDEWLENQMKVAKTEYETVWTSDHHPVWHQVHQGLSRYYDINVLHDLAEAESGWDMTPRFERKCLDFLPVDLNALLFKYETDFVRTAKILGNEADAAAWDNKAQTRKAAMDELMWAKVRGFYFDYNYAKGEQSGTWSLAAYYTLWSGMASELQANRLVENLAKFEKNGGLTTTTRPLIDMSIFGSLKTQWAYPNGWAPLHYIVVEGLKRYGYHKEAERIARKWLKTNTDWFDKHGVFLEKYNVVNPSKPPLAGVYPSQTGFGWTNAIYERFCEEFIDE